MRVGRSCALLPGFFDIVRHAGLPLRLLEIGASAGLNLRWDHFPFLAVPAAIRVIERSACDLNPIDPTLDESSALLCFIWPDQADRLQQFTEVLEIARRVPEPVDRSDAVPCHRLILPNRARASRPSSFIQSSCLILARRDARMCGGLLNGQASGRPLALRSHGFRWSRGEISPTST